MLIGVWLKDVCEVSSFSLRRNAKPVRAEARKTRFRIQTGLRHPNCMVFLDGGLDGTSKPLSVFVLICPIQLVIDLQSHVG